MTTQPIAGNQSFTGITNATAQLSVLNVGRITAASIDGKLTEFTVTGYAPSDFATAADGAKLNLNKAPGLPQATATTDPNLLRIPKRAALVSAYVTNNGTTITSGGGAVLKVGVSTKIVSDPGFFFMQTAFDNESFGACNIGFFGGKAGSIPTPTTETFGAVQVNNAALTDGDLKVTLTLMAIP
tara:strand:- start:76 stop:627 length:552 start_codon:yes stop_codon:yes gene_type:complete